MRLLADMGVSLRVVDWLRTAGHDVCHLRDDGLQRASDDEIFAKAITEQRVLITFDLDFGEIIAASGGQVASTILFRLRSARSSYVIRRLTDVLASVEAELMQGAIVVVEDARYRVRRLPIA